MADNEEIIIEASKRDGSGKEYARKLRAAGKIPAVLNHKGSSTKIELNPKFLSKAWLRDKTFTLDLAGEQKQVLIKELQLDPAKRRALHVDLTYV